MPPLTEKLKAHAANHPGLVEQPPTPGDCYALTLSAFLSANRQNKLGPETALCHGYPHLTADDGDTPAGTMYGHAWLEYIGGWGAYCFDVCTGRYVPREIYYAAGQIDADLVERYSVKEACLAALRKKSAPSKSFAGADIPGSLW